MMTETTISILGCGWLGLALGEHLHKLGYSVKGSTTTAAKLQKLEEAGIVPYQLELDTEGLQGENTDGFLNTDVLIADIPPGRKDPQTALQYPEKCKHLAHLLAERDATKLLFIGSTSVYANINREVHEEDAGQGELSHAGRALYETEKLLGDELGNRLTILRFGGLIGYDRQPGRFLRSGKRYSGGDRPVNLIHRDDCLQVIRLIIEQDAWGYMFNGVTDAHPTRKAFYEQAARKLGLEPPAFADSQPPSYKIVRNDKIKEQLGFRPVYPDPLDCL